MTSNRVTLPERRQSRCRAIAATLLVSSLAGCVANTTLPPAQARDTTAILPEALPATPTQSIDLDRLDALLTEGDEALRDERLLTPIDDSAYDYYQAALAIAPAHPAALSGLDRLVDRYLVLATDAARRSRYDRAKNLLERAKFVNSAHEGIPVLEAQLTLFERSERRRIALDGAALSARSKELGTRLEALGVEAKAGDAWVVIAARNDAEGRWIYQQLRRAHGETRIRAELVIDGSPSIEIVHLSERLTQ